MNSRFLGNLRRNIIKRSTIFRKFVFEDSIIGNLYALKILIPNPNEPLIVDARNNNPIHIAADKGHVEIVKYFIENTEGLKAGNKFGCTPLQMAIFYDNQEVVKINPPHHHTRRLLRMILVDIGQGDMLQIRRIKSNSP